MRTQVETQTQMEMETTRATSPALSDMSELTVLSRSPSPVAGYAEGMKWSKEELRGEFSAARGVSPAPSDGSELTVLSKSPSPVPGYAEGMGRAVSPAGSDVSELTVLSRSPSLVPGYAEEMRQLDEKSREVNQGVNFKMAGSGRSVLSVFTSLRTRNTQKRSSRPPLKLQSTSSHIGDGLFGTLDILPREVRQSIFAYTLDTSHPITLKPYCGPLTTPRERTTCRTHRPRLSPYSTIFPVITPQPTCTGHRLALLQLSRDINEEATWVLYNKCTVLLEITKGIEPYIRPVIGMTLRGMSSFVQNGGRASTLWRGVARFRSVRIKVPEEVLETGDPWDFVSELEKVVSMVCLAQHQTRNTAGWDVKKGHWLRSTSRDAAKKLVNIYLGSLFHQMLPFNYETQAAERYSELLDWLAMHSPDAEPNFVDRNDHAEYELMRMLKIVGNFGSGVNWVVQAKDGVKEKDEGGKETLKRLQEECLRCGVEFFCA